MWERGLKHGEVCRRIAEHGVAPRVGAWIETPRMEETAMRNGSLPVWERGLKHHGIDISSLVLVSLPVWERGLKRRHNVRTATLIRRSPCGSVD